ncbi:hypothetical protein C1752_01281 [Acaryochloris thomasi RCC1774]|uniref:ECF transporter S component n=1 Tax=Acaryochloris thomasi RCC1774 TaxID=1764569 RepID=A0A2W1JLV1_9CYAN|nr:hypothetical protein [Acaryochloris thomasi]PZD74269.1 hypothetical protein C1752_01281 [Acaryochloris thomasi RCC1774]
MTGQIPPEAEEREVRFLGSASIDGTPIAYIVVLASVVTALSFIPFSVTLGTSVSAIPLSSGILPLVGFLLGPVAGAVACSIGTFIGAFLAPYTAGILPLTVGGAAVASLAAGLMGARRGWWCWILVGFAVPAYLFLAARAVIQNGVDLKIFVAGTFIDWSALIFLILPVRKLVGRWLQSSDLIQLAMGLVLGTWISGGVAHLFQMSISYAVFNWPQEIWITLIPVIPFEQVVRCVVGTLIGARVITGLRVLFLIKPPAALY